MKKVLFIMHYAPPVYGSNVVGSIIKESELVNSQIKGRYIKIKSSSEVDKVGKFEVKKLFFMVELFFSSFWGLISFRPKVIYLTPYVKGLAFYRDFVLSIMLKLYARLFKAQIYYHYHAKGIKKYTDSSKLGLKLSKIFVRGVNVVLISKYLSNDVEHLKTYKGLLFLNNGIKNMITDEQIPVFQKARQEDKDLNLLFLSNMKESKGVLVTYEAFLNALKTEKYQNLKLHYVGGFSEAKTLNKLKEFIKRDKLEDRVFIHGPKYGSEKDNYLKQAHILLFPTFYPKETFGLVSLEAMQFGVPVISTYEGGVPDVVDDGKTGFLTKQEDVNDLATKLQILLDHPKKRIEMGNAGRKRFMEQFQLETFEKNLVEVLK